ncbi:MAG: enoyl-CoA hydratase/isomerase family protein [Defluviicoccus sp.]|nr:enoyl-CoA hydratase/isomerase family protein [Defluviicoccus sp.]MDE0277034.1 enoyl-CoA hydratase/isomerase family protein [Defluviicoccus sp.]
MTANTYECLRLEIADGVGRIVFDMPEAANALTGQGVRELLDALNACEADEGVGAVVLTGAGRAFCAGFNLREIPPLEDGIASVSAHFRELAMWWHLVLHKIVHIPKPVMAAVNGAAAGSGLGMALCADLVVCSENARFLCAWHTIGLANDATTSYSLAKIVGFRRAQEMMITNRTLDAREALEWGIANRVYPEDAFAATADAIARDLAAAPTHLQAMAKESFHQGWRRSIEEATEYEIRNVMASVEHPYFHDALRRFVEDGGKSSKVQVRLP